MPTTTKGADGAPRVVPGEPDADAVAACEAWLKARGAELVDDGEGNGGRAVDGKASAPKLFVPEDVNAVAHGDQTLDIEDFLNKTLG